MAALVMVGCSEKLVDPTTSTIEQQPVAGAVAPRDGDGSVVSRYAGESWSLGKVPETARQADASKTPIKIGTMNIDNAPVGALPELTQGDEAAVRFINAELGGVNGRPIELVKCSLDLSPEKSQACARKMVDEKVLAVVPGINLASQVAIPILRDAGIPLVGGIPINQEDMTSPMSFQFSGGTAAAFAGFAYHAADVVHAKKVSVVFAQLPQIAGAATKYGSEVLRRKGVDVVDVPFDMFATDMSGVIQKAVANQPDALLVAASDVACATVMNAIADLGVTAKVYLVGACADRKWIDQVGVDRVKNVIFGIELRLDQSGSRNVDTEMYQLVMKTYGEGVNAAGAATVAFNSFMNLYGVLSELGDAPTSDGVVSILRASKDRPGFNSHSYTCDGKQMPDLPSLCSPELVLAKIIGPSPVDMEEVSDGWIDVPRVLASS